MFNEDSRKMRDLIDELNKASDAYYNSIPIMSDKIWDEKYEELKSLEETTNIVYPNSPTQNVGYSVVDEINEVKHNHLMLSLDKCHTTGELVKFAATFPCVLSVKCDGLTTTLRYLDGKLVEAETRGNGESGYNVLNNVKTISNVPLTIPFKDELIIDGETIIDWNTFHRINESLPTGKEKFKHPRNLVSGTLSNTLDSSIAAERNMRFIAWRVIKGNCCDSVFMSLKEVEKYGFETVPMWNYTNNSNLSNDEAISTMLDTLQNRADELAIPYDGAVMSYDSYEYGLSLGKTNKFFRHSIAYKFEDELYETTLRCIEWDTSRTGLVNPVAIFDPVNIDGATVTKATLHNVSYIENLCLGIGDRISVYKANQIIPKVHDNYTRSGTYKIPDRCPCCGKDLILKDNDGVKTLYCLNPECLGQICSKLEHAVSKKALNIDGLSSATIYRFARMGWLTSILSIYKLYIYEDKIRHMNGFGDKSAKKLILAIENSKHITLDRFIYALGVPLCGEATCKQIAEKFHNDYTEFSNSMAYIVKYSKPDRKPLQIGCGDAVDKAFNDFVLEHYDEIVTLSKRMIFEKPDNQTSNLMEGLTFVITGSLSRFSNRDELKSKIESMGGKVAGAVSSNTTYLINNDINSNSSKNKKAKQLKVPIITEDQLISMIEVLKSE